MNQQTKGIVHNAFFTKNQRKESLSSSFSMPQGTDMDLYDFEFNPDGSLSVIHTNNCETQL